MRKMNLLIGAVLACGLSGCVDQDGDGYAADEDCDDRNPAVYPGAPETCDGVDNNCNGGVDEGTACPP